MRALWTATAVIRFIEIYQAYTAVNREADGADYLERALESAPGDAEDYKYQAQVHYYLGDYEKAKEDLSKAGEEEDDESRLLLGKLCLESEDAAAARSLCIKITWKTASGLRKLTTGWLSVTSRRKITTAPCRISAVG